MKKILAILLIITSVLLSGCNLFKRNDADNNDTQIDQILEDHEGEEVSITVWEDMNPYSLESYNRILKEFEEIYPNITIATVHFESSEIRNEYIKATQAGRGPDIIYTSDSNISHFADAKVITPVEDVIGVDIAKDINSNIYDCGLYNSEKYILPSVAGNHIALIYNKDLIDSAPSTWEDLLAFADKVETSEIYDLLYYESEAYWFLGFYHAFGGQIMDAQGNPTLDNEAMIKALTFAKDIHDEYELGEIGMGYNFADEQFKAGKCAFTLNSSWMWNMYEMSDMNVGICPFPAIPNGSNPKYFLSTYGYMISSQANDDNVWAYQVLFDYLLSTKNNYEFAYDSSMAPTVKEAIDMAKVSEDPIFKGFGDTIEYTVPLPINDNIDYILSAIRVELPKVLSGDYTPETGATKMQETAIYIMS